MEKVYESQSVCKSCGLCCSGYLFAWVRLNANELDKSEALGLNVIRNDPHQRGLHSHVQFGRVEFAQFIRHQITRAVAENTNVKC